MYFNPKKLAESLSEDTVKLAGVARRAGVSQGYLTALKNAEKEPSAGILGRIAFALGKPVEYFFNLDPLGSDGDSL